MADTKDESVNEEKPNYTKTMTFDELWGELQNVAPAPTDWPNLEAEAQKIRPLITPVPWTNAIMRINYLYNGWFRQSAFVVLFHLMDWQDPIGFDCFIENEWTRLVASEDTLNYFKRRYPQLKEVKAATTTAQTPIENDVACSKHLSNKDDTIHSR